MSKCKIAKKIVKSISATRCAKRVYSNNKIVVIINSPLFETKHELNAEDYLPPLGLGVIATELMRDETIEVKFVDAISENKSLSEIIGFIADLKPNFVGINIFTTNFRNVKKIIESTKIKTSFIIGGISTRTLFEEIFKWKTNNCVDIVYGDGERIATDIVNNCVKEGPVRQHGKMKFYEITNKSKYFVEDISLEALDRRLFQNEPYINHYGHKEVCIYTSRGCIYNCAYCVAARSFNSAIGVRIKKVDSIVAELTGIKSKSPDVKFIRILDDLFLRSPQSVANANAIFMQFNFLWRAMCHIRPLHSISMDSLIELRDNGCEELFVGLESGSKRIMNKIRKESNVDLILGATEKCFKAGIHLKGYFICGFPTETIEDIESTLQLANTIKQQAEQYGVNFRTSTFQFRPYHGTELYYEVFGQTGSDSSSALFKIRESQKLNSGKYRKAFNFDSGNYSDISDEILEKYINRMNEIK